jgi:VanZ family protein
MIAVLVFITAYTVGLTAYGVAIDSPLTYVYLGITLLLVATFGVFHYFTRFPLSLLWLMAVVGLVNTMGGVLLADGDPLYAAGRVGPVPFDKLFHALAGLALAFIAWHVVRRFAGDGYHRTGLVVINLLVVMGGGAVVEIAELIGTALSDVSVGDYGNNALDLVANALGAAVGCTWLYFKPRT